MKIIRSSEFEYIPASHEDPVNPGVFKKVLLTKNDLIKGRLQMLNWAKLGVGNSFVPHYHEDMEEVFIILNGRIEVSVNDEKDYLSKGDIVIVPPKAIHSMKNISEEDVEYLVFGISQELGGKTIIKNLYDK